MNLRHLIGVPGTLTIIFLVLKLAGVITWPWITVVSPLWIVALITIGLYAGLKFEEWRLLRAEKRYYQNTRNMNAYGRRDDD